MIMFPLLILYVVVAVVWAGAVAYRRKAVHRLAILLTAVALPAFAVVGITESYSAFGAYKLNLGAFRACLLVALSAYITASIAIIVWSHCGKSARALSGFPIEPINSVTPNDSDPV
jgi:hypothetical protein